MQTEILTSSLKASRDLSNNLISIATTDYNYNDSNVPLSMSQIYMCGGICIERVIYHKQ